MLVEQNTLVVEEREREIRQIVQSISDLNEIFRDLGAMIVEQVCILQVPGPPFSVVLKSCPLVGKTFKHVLLTLLSLNVCARLRHCGLLSLPVKIPFFFFFKSGEGGRKDFFFPSLTLVCVCPLLAWWTPSKPGLTLPVYRSL